MRLPLSLCLSLLLWLLGPDVSRALEFTADQITRVDGRTKRTVIYYRDEMWRLEHFDTGPVNVTIVRKDKQLMWLLLSRVRHFKTVPYDPAQAPKVSEHLEGEIGREEIGTEILDGHPTTLYLVTVQTATPGLEQARTEVYYQWLATDIRFPLKLAKKDANWVVEYRNVRLRRVSDFHFQLPVNFRPLEEFDKPAPSSDMQPDSR